MPTIGSVINNGQGQVIAKLPGGAPGTETLLVRKTSADGNTAPAAKSGGTSTVAPAPGQLSEAEKRIVAELQARDREVRNEEQRHAATAGQFGGEPQYVLRRGPDGKMYAVEGKVQINAQVSGTPEDREKALRRIQAAAVSVQSPSSGDTRAVASAATALVAQDGKQPQSSEAERRQQAEKAYRQSQGTQQAADLAKEIFGAVADQRV
ncbi:putative metalloprotease CJM1_0395 family protein [Dongia rigui]|uniref:Metalloprotease CJM1_0395 family protein n=1 Tax=Dongia rigui TaxID=940149 RepID=A0ABU5DUP3_9PROT|nr:putative metalloprotease CJM1_0395 family protein [Dongia rigui]MDY0870665.1 putative metalloprotease CJM1_0395 family protein [Dongia rigui]